VFKLSDYHYWASFGEAVCHAVERRCRRELGRGSADRRHVGRVRLDSVSSIARPQASVVQCDVTGLVCNVTGSAYNLLVDKC
jgi:hypothetical protein